MGAAVLAAFGAILDALNAAIFVVFDTCVFAVLNTAASAAVVAGFVSWLRYSRGLGCCNLRDLRLLVLQLAQYWTPTLFVF